MKNDSNLILFKKMIPEDSVINFSESLFSKLIFCASFKEELIYPFLMKVLFKQCPKFQGVDMSTLVSVDIKSKEYADYLEIIRTIVAETKDIDSIFTVKAYTILELINDKNLLGRHILFFLVLLKQFGRFFGFFKRENLVDTNDYKYQQLIGDYFRGLNLLRINYKLKRLEDQGYIREKNSYLFPPGQWFNAYWFDSSHLLHSDYKDDRYDGIKSDQITCNHCGEVINFANGSVLIKNENGNGFKTVCQLFGQCFIHQKEYRFCLKCVTAHQGMIKK